MSKWINRLTGGGGNSPEPRVLSAQPLTVPASQWMDTAVPTQPAEPGLLSGLKIPAVPGEAAETLAQASTPFAANDSTPGGLTVAPFEIASSDQLVRHNLIIEALHRPSLSRSKSFKVHDSLEGKIVPVALTGDEHACVLLVNAQYRKRQEVEDIAAELVSRGWKLHSAFQVVVVGQTLLSSIAQGDYGSKQKSKGKSDESNLYQTFVHIVSWGFKNNAADIDFIVERTKDMSRVGFSIHGKWVFPPAHDIPTDMLKRVLGAVYQRGSGQADSAIDWFKEQSLNIDLELDDSKKTKVMLRWAGMAADTVYTVTTRVIEAGSDTPAIPLKDLGYLQDHLDVFDRVLVGDGGGIFLTGVVNSGKSTTIDSLLCMIPETQKIVTIEDPVEKIRPGRIANTVARALTGEDSAVMRAKLKTLKRTGFNVAYLGEIRDLETARAAQDVFESGQRLYTTLHCGKAWEIPGRLAGLGIERSVLATPGNLRLLAYQALIAKNCDCAIPLVDLMNAGGDRAAEWKGYAARMHTLFDASLDKVRIRNEDGCPKCRKDGLPVLNGYRGRTVVAELLEPDEEFCDLISQSDTVGMLHYLRAIRGGDPYDSPRMVGKSAFDCAIYKVLTGELDPQSVEARFESFKSRLAKDEARRARASQTTLRRVGEGAHRA